jgi:hypothetical protein
MGRMAAKTLLDWIEGRSDLVIRNSTAPAPPPKKNWDIKPAPG